jgi:threonine/homoserine/homoserine lactone efflux protein
VASPTIGHDGATSFEVAGEDDVLLRTIGEVLPTAVGIGLSPFPVIALVLLLGSSGGRRNGLTFASGWLVALSALMAALLILVSSTDETNGTSAMVFDVARVVVGCLLIGLAVKKWRTRPRSPDEVVLPGWMAALDSATPRRALVLGLGLAGANPKNLALGTAAATSIVDLSNDRVETVVAGVVFVLLSSAALLAAVAYRIVAGERAAGPLESVKQFMTTNNAVIVMVVLLVLGASILGDGIRALGG